LNQGFKPSARGDTVLLEAYPYSSKSAWFILQTRCPVSGLPITHPLRFVCRLPGSNFSMDMATLGNRIILVKAAGYMRSVDEDEFLACFEDYRIRHFPEDTKLIAVEDFSGIQGAAAEARKKYVAYFKESDFLIGGIIYHLSPLFKISFNLAKRLQIYGKDMYAEDSYAKAVYRAIRLINQSSVEPIHYPPRAGSPSRSLLVAGGQYLKPWFTRFQSQLGRFKLNWLSFLNPSLTKQYANALLKYIESINWQKDGGVTEASTQYMDPSIRQVFDAIGFIKSEVDRLIHERLGAEQELLAYQEKLKGLSIQLSATQETERRKLASQLHDTVSQELFVAQLQLNTLAKKIDDEAQASEISRIRDQLRKIIKDTKSLTFDLSPPVLYDFGLKEALDSLAASIEQEFGVAIHTSFNGDTDKLGNEIKTILYRSIDELFHNTLKHAGANNIFIAVNHQEGWLVVDFKDDGSGFDIDQAGADSRRYQGFGFFDIREKMNHLGGNLEIDAAVGSGTHVKMTLPSACGSTDALHQSTG